MASLDLATLRVNIEADSSAAIKGVEGIRSAVEGVADEAQQAAKTSESAVKNAADSAAQSVESASKRAGMSIQDVSKKLTEIGGSMTLKVTAPIVAAFPHPDCTPYAMKKGSRGARPHNPVHRASRMPETGRRNADYRPVTRIYLASAVR